jgi:hypothetical protein
MAEKVPSSVSAMASCQAFCDSDASSDDAAMPK